MTAATAVSQEPPALAGELISAAAIRQRVAELARQVRADYEGVDLLLVGVLKAAVTFMVDLARELALPLEMDFMAVSSYGPGHGVQRHRADYQGPGREYRRPARAGRRGHC